jgi:flagellar hook-associated protein FlgK
VASFGLGIGLKALLTSQTALESIGHNVANANTPGYSRQRLEISSSRSVLLRGLSLGNGVQADVVRRTTDALINKRLTLQGSARSRLETRLGGLSQVEALLGEPGELGLSSLVNRFFENLSSLAAAPGERLHRTGVVESAGQMTAQLHQLVEGFAGLRSDTGEQIAAQVDRVNVLNRRILGLNREIARTEAAQSPANDLRDQRELALRELGELLDVTYHEDGSGAVQVYTQGRFLVGRDSVQELSSTTTPDGEVTLRLEGEDRPLEARGGSIGGLLHLGRSYLPGLTDDLDRFSANLIFEMNKAHSTGTPTTGGFTHLTSTYAFADGDGDGAAGDELVSGALPFDVQSGAFYVNVTNETDGSVRRTRIDVDAVRTTVADLVAALDAVPDLSARLDGAGRLQVTAAGGHTFDFGKRLDTDPDPAGAFGGGRASLGAGAAGPYALSDGDSLGLSGPLGTFSVTFGAADFADVTRATPEEVAAALNADAGFAANGLRAVVSGERVVLQSVDEGSAETFTVTGGSSLATFGWSAGTVVNGHDTSVAVELGGSYTGTANRELRFVATADGTVGTTPGLTVDVLDEHGNRLATLDVGEGYEPGTELQIADGLTVRIGFGELSAAHNDSFALTALADSDTSDVLGALGMNALFVGTGAADIELRADIAADPRLLSASAGGAEGDSSTLLALLAVQEQRLDGLEGRTLGGYYGEVVANVGLEVGSTSNALEVERFLEDSLVARREQISGVNVDEELVNLIQFEQAFAAAAQFIQVVSQTQDELLALL